MLPPSNPTKARRDFQSRDCGLDKEHRAQGFAHARTRARAEENQPTKCVQQEYAAGVGGKIKQSLQSRYDAHMQRSKIPWFMIW
jgi:hypothetical protein